MQYMGPKKRGKILAIPHNIHATSTRFFKNHSFIPSGKEPPPGLCFGLHLNTPSPQHSPLLFSPFLGV